MRDIAYEDLRAQRLAEGAAVKIAAGRMRSDKVHDPEQFEALVALHRARMEREHTWLPRGADGLRELRWDFPC
jgi:hypothetical protein